MVNLTYGEFLGLRSRIVEIANKEKYGEQLTPEEEDLLAQFTPSAIYTSTEGLIEAFFELFEYVVDYHNRNKGE